MHRPAARSGTRQPSCSRGLTRNPGRTPKRARAVFPPKSSNDRPPRFVKRAPGADALTEEEKAEVAGLKRRDAETRRHEQAHATAGGPYAGAPSYTYERGPDGRSYAVAGSTPIDVSPISGDPSATVRKMETVKRAALAPAEPSAQDRKVAAQAETEMRAARAEATAQSTSELTGETGPRRAGAVAPPAKSPVEPPGKSPGQSLFAAYGGGGGAGRQPDVSALLDLIA